MNTLTFTVTVLAGALALLPPPADAQQAAAAPVAQPPQPAAPGTAPPQAGAPPSRAVPARKVQGGDSAGPQGFSIVLVMGEMQASTGQNNVPAAAQKALADMKDFLPYKGYRLLDAQWTLCCGRTPVMTRMRGADEQEYELELNAAPTGHDVSVRFQLTEAGSRDRVEAAVALDARVASVARVQRELEQLRARRADLARSQANQAEVKELEQRIEQRERELRVARQESRGGGGRSTSVSSGTSQRRRIIDASFRMDVGETVVVGTSRIQGGDKALIALLTAVPQRGTGAR